MRCTDCAWPPRTLVRGGKALPPDPDGWPDALIGRWFLSYFTCYTSPMSEANKLARELYKNPQKAADKYWSGAHTKHRLRYHLVFIPK